MYVFRVDEVCDILPNFLVVYLSGSHEDISLHVRWTHAYCTVG